MRHKPHPATLTEEERDELRALVQREGLRPLAARLGIHHEPVACAAAGISTRAGTLAIIRNALASSTRRPPPRTAA